jgi:predicted DNA-binding ribbon-helix-helix protein
VKIGPRWTTIRLEPEIMRALREIARGLGIGANDLFTEIACAHGEGSFASAVRVFIVSHYRRRLGVAEVGPSGPLSVKRRTIRPGAADASAELVNLYAWWMDRRPAGGRLPGHGDIDPGVLKRLGLGGMAHIVDVTTEDPLNYRFRVFSKRVASSLGRDFSGSRLGEYPDAGYRSAVAEDYLTAAATETPQFQEVDAWLGGRRRIYQRLIAPFGRSRGKPECLLVAVRYRSPGLVAAPEAHRRAESDAG